MEVIDPSIQMVYPIDGNKILASVEYAARTCYRSEITPDSFGNVTRSCIKRGHTSVLEHESLSFIFTIDNGIMRELTRHRIGSYSIESTRYCNYGKKGLRVIRPLKLQGVAYKIWEQSCINSERDYNDIINLGYKSEDARDVLNLSVAATCRVTFNLRSLRNFFELRCGVGAHPHMKQISIPLLKYIKSQIPIIFDDITYDEAFEKEYLSEGWEQYIITEPASNNWYTGNKKED